MFKNKFSIAIIVVYFGNWPWYFEYFIHSCRYNSSVDFIIITDNNSKNIYLPPNIRIVVSTLNLLKARIQEQLKIKPKFSNPYKLCDFKPAYGIIFADLIKDYSFWGYSDIDIIFGDIRTFLTKKILSSYEFFSFRHDFLTGYFTVIKNKSKTNWLFLESKDYIKVFSSEKHYCFDETNFAFSDFSDGLHFTLVKTEIESMMHVVKKSQEANKIRAYFDFCVIEGCPGKLRWDKGRLFFKSRYEVLLYHLIIFKRTCLNPRIKNKVSNSFRISPSKIY